MSSGGTPRPGQASAGPSVPRPGAVRTASPRWLMRTKLRNVCVQGCPDTLSPQRSAWAGRHVCVSVCRSCRAAVCPPVPVPVASGSPGARPSPARARGLRGRPSKGARPLVRGVSRRLSSGPGSHQRLFCADCSAVRRVCSGRLPLFYGIRSRPVVGASHLPDASPLSDTLPEGVPRAAAGRAVRAHGVGAAARFRSPWLHLGSPRVPRLRVPSSLLLPPSLGCCPTPSAFRRKR